MKPISLTRLQAMKQQREKIAVLTGYDYSFARILDRAEVDIVLVGDSLGMVVQGHHSTLPVTLDDMVYHTRNVARGLERAMLMADLPFLSYQANREQALMSAGRLMQAGAHIVKLEGGMPMADTVRFLVERGIPVCAHIGLMPQAVHQLGGFRVQGRDAPSAQRLREEALILEQAGASLLLLEAVPAALAAEITASLRIPTIGIGAGADCDAQVLVLHDVLGLYADLRPKFAKNFLADGGNIEQAIRAYVAAVRSGAFPGAEHSFT